MRRLFLAYIDLLLQIMINDVPGSWCSNHIGLLIHSILQHHDVRAKGTWNSLTFYSKMGLQADGATMRFRPPQPPLLNLKYVPTPRSARSLIPNHSRDSPEITAGNAPRPHLLRRSDRLDQELVLGFLPADDLSNDRLGDVEIEERDIRDSGLVAVFLEVVFCVYPGHFDKEDVGVLRRGQV